MAVDIEKLVVQLSADLKAYENAMNKAMGITNQRARAIENRWRQSNKVIAGQFARLGGFLVGGAALRGAQQLIDASTRIQNALRVAGLEGAELTRVYDELFISAQKNAAPIETLVTLYGRAALVQKELKVSTEELLRFTDNVATALRVAGTDAQSASGALLQLSQALGSGVVRSQEFNSILEGALPIAQAAAAGLREAGGSVTKLRTLVTEGKVSSEAFFRAFEAGADMLESKVAGSSLTAGQAFVTLQNSLINAAGKFDDATGASGALVREIQTLSSWVEYLGDRFNDLVGPLETVGEWIGAVRQKMQDLREATGLESFFEGTALLEGRVGFADPAVKALEERAAAIDKLREALTRAAATARTDAGEVEAMAQRFADAFGSGQTVSLSDFAPPSPDKSSTADRAERDRQRVLDLIATLQEERRLIGATDADRAVSNALRQAGAAATDTQRKQIEALVRTISTETDALEKLKAQMQEAQGLARDFAGSLIDDLIAGKNATEALTNAFGNLARRLADMAVDAAIQQLFRMLMGGFGFSGGGSVGAPMNLLPAGFDRGGYTGPGAKMKPAGIVHAGEYVFAADAVRKIGVANLDALHRGMKGFASGGFVMPSIPTPRALVSQRDIGGPAHVDLTITVDGQGNIVPVVKQVSGAVAVQVNREQTPRIILDMQRRRMLGKPG